MDLRPTPEQQQLRETLRRLLDRRLAELVEALPDPPRHDRDRALADALAVGLPGLGLPEEFGGAGGFADLVVAHEELGRGLAAPLLTTLTLAGRLLLHTACGTERGRLLGELAAGRRLAAPAVDEDADGAAAITTGVSTHGSGVRLDGRKRRVVNARDVDDLLVLARDQASETTVVVGVPIDADGTESAAAVTAGDIAHWTVTFRSTDVPGAAVLGTLTDAGLARYRIEASVLAAARLLGAGRAVLERTVSHVRTREQFDRPIGTFQAVQHQLADVACDLDSTALAVGQAGCAVDDGSSAEQLSRVAAIALLSARDAARRATLVAHQLHGGMGFVLDSPLHLWSARAVTDPTVPLDHGRLLDQLADASGITAEGIVAPPDHRLAALR